MIAIVVHHGGVLVEAARCGATLYGCSVGIETENAVASGTLQETATPPIDGAYCHIVVFGAGTFKGHKVGLCRCAYHIYAAMSHIYAVGILFYGHGASYCAQTVVLR